MATIAPPQPETQESRRPSPGGPGGGDPGLRGYGGGDFGQPGGASDRRYYTGMFVGLAGVVMLFTAFTSAYIVRKGLSDDWKPFAIPSLVWFNTAVLVASSVALHLAKRSFPNMPRLRRWWWTATALGLAFLAGQVSVWRELAAAGVYVSSNPSSSFFYVLTAAHGLHLLGGVIALLWLSWKLRGGRLTRTATGVMALYWHFMDGLWIYLLLLILIWR